MGSMSGCNQKIRIQNTFITMDDVILRHRIHMVNDWTMMNLIPLDSEVTTVVSINYIVAKMLPLSGRVELLIDPAIETERRVTNLTFQSEVAKTLFEVRDLTQFGVGSSPHSSHPQIRARQEAAGRRRNA